MTGLSFSPDGRRLAAATRANSNSDGSILVWDLESPRNDPQVFQGHTGPVQAVSFHPDGQRLPSAGYDGTVRVWDLRHPDGDPVVLRH
jgi:WD40 repeat protein